MTKLIDPSRVAYVVVDMETTGTDVNFDLPLELGLGLFDGELNELAMNSWLIRPDYGWRERLEVNHFVKDMHTKNGLIADIEALPEFYYETDAEGKQHQLTYDMPMVSFQAWQWLAETCGLASGEFPMTGSSIGALDRPFLKDYLPSVHGFFTYRSIDVSSLKELCKRLNPKLYREMKAQAPFLDANKEHRVRADVRASAAELKFYIENFLRVQPEELVAVGQMELPIPEA
jgi:oligoribonuclease (3'-5' exoribonuclease)